MTDTLLEQARQHGRSAGARINGAAADCPIDRTVWPEVHREWHLGFGEGRTIIKQAEAGGPHYG